MSLFGPEYASAYDFLYQDKDYKKECDFLEAIFTRHSSKVRSILDLGCGTAGHAILLAKRGYEVTGVDRSAEMIAAARKKCSEKNVRVKFRTSEIQTLKTSSKFDIVISMFAVMSYQTENRELAAACQTARRHLKRGGLFIFDAWHGIGVMTDPPTQRVKEIREGENRIIRITTPHVKAESHLVDTHFKVLKFHKDSLTSETEETHVMRFLFPQEIRYFLETAGFSDVSICPFLKLQQRLSENDWNMTVIAK